jgi:hypothetical protein
VNIESDEELLRKYKYDIDGVETFIHHIDPQDFIRAIRG